MHNETARSGDHFAPRDVPQEIVFGPTRGWSIPNLGEVWEHRELLFFLAWRDIKVRYKQTVIGAAWAIFKPVMTMLVFSAIFGSLIGVPSSGVPYPIFVFTGLLPWTFFASALGQSGSSLVANANLISKVYFPRLVLPLASVLVSTLDFAVAFVVLLAMMLFYRVIPGAAILLVPLFLLLALLTALGAGLWLSALQVKYRDVGHTVPFLTQFWLFLTPVIYPSSLIPEQWRLLYGLNPMVSVVEGFRWSLLGNGNAPGSLILVSTTVVIAMFVGGLFFFRRVEREFADVV
ncbi:MAG TPA: ABC transporter permease [Herpetosiphonaceae bacterium]|nr:ABC transporter permease [Herpetosiphonaceae bacterium]